jgi:hypothetical protein
MLMCRMSRTSHGRLKPSSGRARLAGVTRGLLWTFGKLDDNGQPKKGYGR